MARGSAAEDFARAAVAAEIMVLQQAELYARGKRKLKNFIQVFWHVIEPGRPFLDNWSIGAVCEHLQAVSDGQIQQLLINVPPRTMKSTTVSVGFPVWTWIQDAMAGQPPANAPAFHRRKVAEQMGGSWHPPTRRNLKAIQRFLDVDKPEPMPEQPAKAFPLKGPGVRFLTGSHSTDLATRDAVASRRIMEHPSFKEAYGKGFRMTSDQNTKTRYENDKRGFRIAFGTKTGITGEGGDIISLDDPHGVIEGMYSEQERTTVLTTWDMQIANRLNDPKTGARIITMQRLHQDDLSGHVMRERGYVHLCLPQEFDPARRCMTVIGFQDPRTKPGELLWPSRFDEAFVAGERKRLGPYGYSGQHQQSPTPAEGGVIPVAAFKRFKLLDDETVVAWAHQTFDYIICAWDTAQKEKDMNDPWAGGVWGKLPTGQRYLLEVVRRRMGYPDGKRAVKELAAKWRPHVTVIEDKSTGSSLIQELPNEGVACLGQLPVGDKVMRASVESPAIHAGMVYIPEEAPWLHDYLTEAGAFPNATKDQIDMTSVALRHLREQDGVQLDSPPHEETAPSIWGERYERSFD
jgi:predicted phage terminase large subunit-like protein